MSDGTFVAVAGSHRPAVPNAEVVGELDSQTRIEITVVLRRRSDVPRTLVEGRATLGREEFADRYGADPADVNLVQRVLSGHGLEIVRIDEASRRIHVAGTVGRLSEVFGTDLRAASLPHSAGTDGFEFRLRTGELRVPAEAADAVIAVLGLDTRPQTRAHMRLASAPAAAQVSYSPPELATVYGFPADTDGTGQTIAIIELGGGFGESDLNTYFGGLNLPTPSVTAVGVDGAKNKAGADPEGADGEVLLDIEVAGALAPGAKQMVYFAPNTDQGFVDAVSEAIHANPTPIAVSISWGATEDSWTDQARNALDAVLADAAALGVTVTAAAGDNGSSDAAKDGKAHADFPASSPHVLACGGTSLQASGGTVRSETVWNDGSRGGATGGGVSDVFTLPVWQQRAGVPARDGGNTGRGVPDVAAVADPATGYQVLIDGTAAVIGGTSAVAPLWAALVARLAQRTGSRFGLLQPLLYAGAAQGEAAPGFRDITAGNNGQYEAGPGWDACTGLGVPDGTTLVTVLKP